MAFQQSNDIDNQAATLGAAWNTVTGAERRAIKIAMDVLGKDSFAEAGASFVAASQKAHEATDALRAKFLSVAEVPVPQRQTFVEEYVREMPENLDTLYDATLALVRALRDFTPTNSRGHKQALQVIADLEKLQPERAAEYNTANPPTRGQPKPRRGAKPPRDPS